MKRILCLPVVFFTLLHLFPQGTDIEYERIRIADAKNIICGLDLSPDQTMLAISSVQSYPFYIFDWRKREKVKEYDVGNWYAGSSVHYSSNGKYILLNQLYYVDFAPNKDREVNFEVIDAKTGKNVKRFENFHDVKITPDEKYALTLTGDEIGFYNLSTGKYDKSFSVPEATNSLAISPGGKLIAVSHKLYEKDAKGYSLLKRDKKTMKNALKFKQEITIFDAGTFKKLYTVHELYDIVYKLTFSADGKHLFVLSIPHQKLQNTQGKRQSYINVVDMETGKPMRKGFVSRSVYEPDFKLSHDGKLLGIVSSNDRFLELHIYDFATGKMAYRFQQAFRIIERSEGEYIAVDPRSSFVFLPDNKSTFMTVGNRLIKWDFAK
ncbi:MAG: hypothetical protein GXO86_15655 [Chlorobi bacterium]|nr:hypothetical protein [Chlorobiota bacterium]